MKGRPIKMWEIYLASFLLVGVVGGVIKLILNYLNSVIYAFIG